jgi:antitoxin (DNA-binding transcriptional repressor) of toxin-antitoxin stability system
MIEVSEADLPELVKLVQQGEEVVLAQNGVPVVKLLPLVRVPNLFPGTWTSDDFDDPLPDEFWFGQE